MFSTVYRKKAFVLKIPLYPPEAVKKFSYSEAWGGMEFHF
jgi:hypothetical protein